MHQARCSLFDAHSSLSYTHHSTSSASNALKVPCAPCLTLEDQLVQSRGVRHCSLQVPLVGRELLQTTVASLTLHQAVLPPPAVLLAN